MYAQHRSQRYILFLANKHQAEAKPLCRIFQIWQNGTTSLVIKVYPVDKYEVRKFYDTNYIIIPFFEFHFLLATSVSTLYSDTALILVFVSRLSN